MKLPATLNGASRASLLAAAVAVGVVSLGCQATEKPTTETAAKPQSPATGPTMNAQAPIAPTTKPAAVAAAAKLPDPTHTLIMDEPYYASMPLGEAKPDGTIKSGTKVLLMVPGSKYAKVTTPDSTVSGYVETKGLESISKK